MATIRMMRTKVIIIIIIIIIIITIMCKGHVAARFPPIFFCRAEQTDIPPSEAFPASPFQRAAVRRLHFLFFFRLLFFSSCKKTVKTKRPLLSFFSSRWSVVVVVVIN